MQSQAGHHFPWAVPITPFHDQTHDDSPYLLYERNYSSLFQKEAQPTNTAFFSAAQDAVGHTHRSQFNYPGGYCYIPEYIDGATKRGACHLRIYFDEDTDIKYMVFMPLSYSTATRLAKNNEIVYQKIKK